ncbi:zinc transporter ZupT [Tissierella creatinini]|nr:zinc transporter ZupT [Tissierella creatinini]TJX64553.1 zinc transporter ZupT [Soehngenia saccharolytica]
MYRRSCKILNNITESFALTLLVGLTMGLGSLLSFFVTEKHKSFFSISLSLSAGIMIYISFMEILPEGIHLIEQYMGEGYVWIALIWFFFGMFLTAVIEKFVHAFAGSFHSHKHNSHRHHAHDHEDSHLSKLGIMSALAIAMHNVPEGLALFTTGIKDIALAYPVALAIIIHNVPLAVAISVPLVYSTGSRKKAFLYTTFVGLMQPIGAIIGYMLLANFLNDMVFGILLSLVAGIMIFVSLDELLPAAQQDVDHHLSVYGAVAGMIIMALALSFFGHSH